MPRINAKSSQTALHRSSKMKVFVLKFRRKARSWQPYRIDACASTARDLLCPWARTRVPGKSHHISRTVSGRSLRWRRLIIPRPMRKLASDDVRGAAKHPTTVLVVRRDCSRVNDLENVRVGWGHPLGNGAVKCRRFCDVQSKNQSAARRGSWSWIIRW